MLGGRRSGLLLEERTWSSGARCAWGTVVGRIGVFGSLVTRFAGSLGPGTASPVSTPQGLLVSPTAWGIAPPRVLEAGLVAGAGARADALAPHAG
jgi:hypothetical protein